MDIDFLKNTKTFYTELWNACIHDEDEKNKIATQEDSKKERTWTLHIPRIDPNIKSNLKEFTKAHKTGITVNLVAVAIFALLFVKIVAALSLLLVLATAGAIYYLNTNKDGEVTETTKKTNHWWQFNFSNAELKEKNT